MRKEISRAFLALATLSIILFLTSCVSRTIESTENLDYTIDIQPKEISYENLQRNNSKLRETEKTEEKEEEFIVDLTQDELETFYMLVFAEDGIEDEDTQVAVAATFLNRMLSDSFSSDFYEVLYQDNAFSSVHNEKIYIMTDNPYEVTLDMIPESTKNAVHRALMGEDPTEEALRAEARRLGLDEEYYAQGGALYFYSPSACSQEALAARESIQVKVKIGLQYYYKVWG